MEEFVFTVVGLVVSYGGILLAYYAGANWDASLSSKWKFLPKFLAMLIVIIGFSMMADFYTSFLKDIVMATFKWLLR